jgi:heme A synthase
MRSAKHFPAFAWTTLLVNILVVLWGVVVRATGSGAGCGAHWPTCDGEIVPGLQSSAQWIEYTHRLSSGLALILVVVMLIWAFLAYESGHAVRKGAVASMFFMILESLVGAALVLFGWVEADDSMARVYIMGIHLTNTLLLLGALFLTAYWSSGGKVFTFRGQGALGWLFLLGNLAAIVLVVTGAIIALGDSLFLQIGLTPEQSPVLAGILALRNTHPITSIIVGLFWILLARYAMVARPTGRVTRPANVLIALILLSWAIGFLNNWLHAPVVMQVVHLLFADMFWLGIVWLSAEALAVDAPRAAQVRWSQVFTG